MKRRSERERIADLAHLGLMAKRELVGSELEARWRSLNAEQRDVAVVALHSLMQQNPELREELEMFLFLLKGLYPVPDA